MYQVAQPREKKAKYAEITAKKKKITCWSKQFHIETKSCQESQVSILPNDISRSTFHANLSVLAVYDLGFLLIWSFNEVLKLVEIYGESS